MDLQNIIKTYTTAIASIKNINHKRLFWLVIIALVFHYLFLHTASATVSSDELDDFVTEITYLNKESIEYAKGSEKYIYQEEQVKNQQLDKSDKKTSVSLKVVSHKSKNDKIAYLDPESLKYEEGSKKKTEKKPDLIKKSEQVVTGEPISEPEQASGDEEILADTGDAVTEATTSAVSADDPEKYSRLDPLIDYNRDMYYVNKNIDKYIIKPPAKVYSYIIPSPVKHMVTNFFSNIQDINVLINDILQLEVENSVDTIYRVVLNSTFGIFGLLDVAGDSGFPKRANDFGVTFGKWFEPESVYFVIPILGPSTIRDTIGTAVGGTISFGYYLPNDYVWPLTGLYILDKRANLLTTEKIIDTIAADEEYEFVRNAYLDYRARLISGESIAKKDEHKEQKLLEDIITSDEVSPDEKLDNLDELDDLEDLKDLE